MSKNKVPTKEETRKLYLRDYQKAWMRSRRQAWLSQAGPCVRCGTTENLEIDHIDPKKKKYNIAEIWSRKAEIRESELKKCQVLCEPCHIDKTQQDRKAGVYGPCGTEVKYGFGCRCDLCKRAKADAQNEYRWRTGQRKRRGKVGRPSKESK